MYLGINQLYGLYTFSFFERLHGDNNNDVLFCGITTNYLFSKVLVK